MCYNINMTETIKTKMQEKGLTQKKMAELVGVSQAYISYIANRQRTPSLRIALRLPVFLIVQLIFCLILCIVKIYQQKGEM